MSGTVGDRKRLFKVTAGNLRQNHLYVNGHYDFFPADCIGSSRRKDGTGRTVQIILDGLNKTIETDIGTEAGNGKPRRFFRERRWFGKFFEHHGIKTGDVLAMERVGDRRYHLYCFEAKRERADDWRQFLDEPPEGKGPTVLELFAGCGGMALGFKSAGFRTVLAVEWDKAACESLRRNVTDGVAQCAIQEIEQFPLADVIAGGHPCQGLCNLGERVPNDPRDQLWRQYMRAVA